MTAREDGFSRARTRVPAAAPPKHGMRRRGGDRDALRLPGYELVGMLGRGGMAVVYKARQLSRKRLVAIKVLKCHLAEDEQVVARFLQEYVLAARLRHPNLIAMYETGHACNRPYLVMEFLEGQSLGAFIGQYGALDVAEACEVIRQAALGLQHLHEHGVVHRDVKPSNLMLTRYGRVKLLDLGLARNLCRLNPEERFTSNGQFLGTLDYVAPEQCVDAYAVDCRADVYGLGCTLYELLTGQPPFAGPGYDSAFQKMQAHVEAPVPRILEKRADVPDHLVSALERMLAKDREQRFASSADVVAVMQQFAAGAELTDLPRSLPFSAVPAA
jgi:serine/threonine protein kinase